MIKKKIEINNFIIELLVILFSIMLALLLMMFAGDSVRSFRVMIIVLTIISFYLLKKMLHNFTINKNYGELVIIIGLIFWYIIPAAVNILLNDQLFASDISGSIDKKIILLVLISFSVFLFFWRLSHFIFYTKKGVLKEYPINFNVKRIVYISVIGCLLGLIPYFIGSDNLYDLFYAIFEGRAIEKTWLLTSNIGTEKSAYTFLIGSIFYASLTIIWICLLDNGIKNNIKIYLFLFVLFLTIIIYFDQGTRSIFALLVLPFIILLLIYQWEALRKEQSGKIKFTIGLSIVVFISFLLLQYQMLYRLISTRGSIESLIFSKWVTLGGSSDYFSETVVAFSIVPAVHDYFHESALFHFIISPIPRFLWHSKPLPEIVWFFTKQKYGLDIFATGGNSLPGIIGYYYMSWGWMGIILLGLLAGFVSAKIDMIFAKINMKKDSFRAGIAFMFVVWVFLSFRNLGPGFLYPVIIAFFILKVSKLANKKMKV